MVNFLLILLLLTGGFLLADPPQNHRSDRYRELYLNSPITDPPPEQVAEPEVNDLPDWVLVGVTKYLTGTVVKIMNVKDRTRVVIPSAEASELGFSVQNVVQDRNFIDHTVVTLKKGSAVGEVRFDPQFLVLKKVAAPAPSSSANASRSGGRQNRNTDARSTNQPPTPPGARSSNNAAASPPRPGQNPRAPRTRRIPPPQGPSAASSPAAASSGSTAPATPATPAKRTRYVPRPRG